MKTVIYHSADYDGIFCREIAKKFLGEQDVQYIGWNFGDPKVPNPIANDTTYILDLSPECLESAHIKDRLVWIDHHKTSIEKWPKDIPGYRIDGVAACRLAWQWFMRGYSSNQEMAIVNNLSGELPQKQDFLDRKVTEPLAVRLAGEYDIWDHRGDGDLQLQFGLRSVNLDAYRWSLLLNGGQSGDDFTRELTNIGQTSMDYAKNVDAGNMKASFLIKWEGLTFLCLNGRGNSNTFASRDIPETGHDANLMFYFQGRQWIVSLYHAKHRKDLDLSAIAVRHGGGGHAGACGFQCDSLPFLANPT